MVLSRNSFGYQAQLEEISDGSELFLWKLFVQVVDIVFVP